MKISRRCSTRNLRGVLSLGAAVVLCLTLGAASVHGVDAQVPVRFFGDRAPLARTIALLDLTARNKESNSSTFSLGHALDVAGIPYIETTDVSEASSHAMVVTSSYLGGTTFSSSEENALSNYVSGGGILVSTNMTNSNLHSLFGITGNVRLNTRRSMMWQTGTHDPSLDYFDDPNEQTISLGRSSYASVIYTRGYFLVTATSLAKFDDSSNAVTKNMYGAGKAYALGFSYTDVILRNQLNLDYNAQRTYSNGFEPTSDTIILFLRAVYQANVPFAVWKHTSPYASTATLIVTHDVDSKTAMDAMNSFADMENAWGISATYNVTTRYFKDSLGTNYYNALSILQLQSLVAKNQMIGSHSVGHFPDWDNETRFPIGTPGQTSTTYTPYNNGVSTVGGNVYGELEVSSRLLETDLATPVRTFRSGHLLWNDKQINVLDALGYEYDSSQSANDVLTNFPYLSKYDKKFSGAVSRIYEIPMTISDSGMTATNYNDIVTRWLNVIIRNAANSAVTVLLIHPNRTYKVTAEESMLDQLAPDVLILDMDSFGDYWRERDGLRFDTSLSGNILTITISSATPLPLDEKLSIAVKNGQSLSDIIVRFEDGAPMEFVSESVGDSDVVLSAMR